MSAVARPQKYLDRSRDLVQDGHYAQPANKMSSIETKPFRFLNLPTEIRLNVYEKLFEGAILAIDAPLDLVPVDSCWRNPDKLRAVLPGLLLGSKQVRAEAVPVFSSSLTLEICCPRPVMTESLIPTLPEAYTEKTTVALLQDNFCVLPRHLYLPALEELQIGIKLAPNWLRACYKPQTVVWALLQYVLRELAGLPSTESTKIWVTLKRFKGRVTAVVKPVVWFCMVHEEKYAYEVCDVCQMPHSAIS